jgi:hypothetical protein
MQQDPGWEVVANSTIAPNNAKIALSQQPAGLVPSLLISTTGIPGKYSGAVARSADYPVPPNTSRAVLTAIFALDPNFLINGQSLEMGFKLTTPKGITLNGQFQFDCGKSATEMIFDLTSIAGSGWAPTPVVLPKFTPNVLHVVRAHYQWVEGVEADGSDSYISAIAAEIDGALYATAPAMLKVPGKALGWGAGLFQTNFQPNVNQKGGTFQWELLDVSVMFS